MRGSPRRGGTRTYIRGSSVAKETENARWCDGDSDGIARVRESGYDRGREGKEKKRERKRERRNPTIGTRRVRESREEGGERGWHESG